ncbi:MAG: cyclic nucleotide-binding domain-containing protein [Polyangiales bacterium]
MTAPGQFKLTVGFLERIGLFAGMPTETLERLANELSVHRCEVGQPIVKEGATTPEMFVVIGGELEVVKSSKPEGDVRVALLGPGDWFGEMSILDVQPRSASVRALAPTMLIRIGPDDIEQKLYRQDLKAYAIFMMNIARELSRKLRVADGILAQFFAAVSTQYQKPTPSNRT